MSVRQRLGDCMVEAVDWADQHRRSLIWGSLLGICSGTALLLRLHGLPGYSRITTQAQLADRLRQHQASHPRQLRLPVILAGAEVQDGRLVAHVLHYPLLLRWADWYRGTHPARHLQATNTNSSGTDGAPPWEAPPASGTLSCTVAGVQGVDPSVSLLLQRALSEPWRTAQGNGSRQQWPRVLQLQAFALTAAQHTPADATTAVADSAVSSSADSQLLDGSGSSSRSRIVNQVQLLVGREEAQQPLAEQACVWAELWVKDVTRPALRAAAAQAAAARQRPSVKATPTQQQQQQQGVVVVAGHRGWLPQRRRDVAELLLSHGLGQLADPEDCEWLGVRPARWRAYQRAAQRAERLGLGVHAEGKTPSKGLMRRWLMRLGLMGKAAKKH